jgi:hypothetical protein
MADARKNTARGFMKFEVDTAAAATLVGVPAYTIRNWAARGHLQPLRADGTQTIYDADDVTRVAARMGYLPELRDTGDSCAIPRCDRESWPDAPVPLCQKHALAIWLHVTDTIEKSFTPVHLPSNKPVVYFIRSGGRIKIGTSTSLITRLDTYRTHGPEQPQVLLVVEGGRAEEKQVHELFKADRVRGEWFTPSQALLDFIADRQDQDVRNIHGDLHQ